MENVPVNVNRPASEGRHTARPVSDASHELHRRVKKNPNKRKHILIAAVLTVVLLVVGLGGWFLYGASMGAHIDNSKYQAVFFTNGQVYFGKLQKLNGGYFKLQDIFYLQAKSSTTTAADGSKNPQQTSPDKSGDVELIKLGSEVHGPNDEMIINKDQVLFFENLKADGTVTKSIGKFHTPQ